jgi:hypothetical protein
MPANGEEVAAVLAHALRHDGRSKPQRDAAWEVAAAVLAEQLAADLEWAIRTDTKTPPCPPHSTRRFCRAVIGP